MDVCRARNKALAGETALCSHWLPLFTAGRANGAPSFLQSPAGAQQRRRFYFSRPVAVWARALFPCPQWTIYSATLKELCAPGQRAASAAAAGCTLARGPHPERRRRSSCPVHKGKLGTAPSSTERRIQFPARPLLLAASTAARSELT